jgi:putative transposase
MGHKFAGGYKIRDQAAIPAVRNFWFRKFYAIASGNQSFSNFKLHLTLNTILMSYEFTGGYKIRDQAAVHFLTFTIVGWVDVFSRQSYRDIIISSFKYCQLHKGLQVAGWVIMSNHIHTIWAAKNNNLSDILRDFKTFTSRAIFTSIQEEPESRRAWLLHMFRFYARGTNANETFKVWTGDNHPEEIHSEKFFRTKLNYIHENPVRAGLVKEADHYLYSSACSYAGKKGLIEVDFLF